MKGRWLVVGVVLLSFACSTEPGQTVEVPGEDVAEDLGRKVALDSGAEMVAPFEVVEVKDQFILEILPDVLADGFAPQCAPGEGCFLDPCDENEECQSGWCVQHLGGGVCSEACQEECPAGWSCQQVAGTVPDVVYICVSDFANLCRPCHTNDSCTSVGGASDACLDYGPDGNFCGGPCSAGESCPWGFTCKENKTVEGTLLKQCVNDAGECPCTGSSVSLGLTTECELSADAGTCKGKRTCTADGLSSCDAANPMAETCNGIDDDCDGEIDEPELVEGKYLELCTDDNDCTADTCSGENGCVNELLEVGDCNDADPCTVADHCDGGACVGDVVECNDDNPCTDDLCTITGGCEHPPVAGSCDDGDPCTVADQCVAGLCQGTDVDCDCQTDLDCAPFEDGDLCNGVLFCNLEKVPYECAIVPDSVVSCPEPGGIDAICLAAVCDPESGDCSFVPAHQEGACSDQEPCTISDSCIDGACTPGTPLNCNDGDPCTDDSCVAGEGCAYFNNDASCSDGSACTVGDQCANGECVAGAPMACDDGNLCTDDSCSEESGCSHLPNTVACDDGNDCTTGDLCQSGQCFGSQAVDCDDSNVCTDDACVPAGGCVHLLNDAPCDDNDVCTTGDHCQLGECGHSGEFTCDDNNVCTTDSCAALTGCQFASVDGGDCTDANLCTIGDSCAGGLCIPGAAVVCDDQNFCTDDSCEPDLGCVHASNSAPCDDGDVCTVQDVCAGGVCQAGDIMPCSDDNVCTGDSCDPKSGCSYVPLAGDCDDGDTCTTLDSCADGQCVGGPALDCDDDVVCTDDSCDADVGCVHSNNNAACDDGSLCTEGDFCQNGACVPGGAKDCSDNDPCTDDTCEPAAGCQHSQNQNCCTPTGQRVPYNTLVDSNQTACFKTGNPCQYDVADWSWSHIRGFAAFGEYITCGGATGCVAHVGIATYSGGGSNTCRGKWDVYCDGALQCSINILGKTCVGTAKTNGCKCDFPGARYCSTIKLVAAQDGDNTKACCDAPQPDSAIDAVSVW